MKKIEIIDVSKLTFGRDRDPKFSVCVNGEYYKFHSERKAKRFANQGNEFFKQRLITINHWYCDFHSLYLRNILFVENQVDINNLMHIQETYFMMIDFCTIKGNRGYGIQKINYFNTLIISSLDNLLGVAKKLNFYPLRMEIESLIFRFDTILTQIEGFNEFVESLGQDKPKIKYPSLRVA